MMPPRLETDSPAQRVQIIAPPSWLARIDEWRRKQPSIPNRSEAIRILVDRALAAERE
jgi:metal-responsive CopG/Arc/MetJ family transcriptional regulator